MRPKTVHLPVDGYIRVPGICCAFACGLAVYLAERCKYPGRQMVPIFYLAGRLHPGKQMVPVYCRALSD